MELIACIILYIKSFFGYVGKKESARFLAFEGLIQAHSYRLGGKAHEDYLVGFRYLKKALELIWANESRVKTWDSKSKKGVFDDALFSLSERKTYLEAIQSEKIKLFVCKEELGLSDHYLQKTLESIVLLGFSIIITPCTFFYKYRASLALNLLELVECTRMLQHFENSNIQYVYYFCGFNKDANFVALRLAEKSIYCHKIPSSNPIKNFYQKVISDQFSFTAAFQRREYESLKQNWKVKELSDWPVFRFQTIQPLLNSYSTPTTNSLGFISSAIWRRLERGDLALGVGELDAELKLIDFLKSYVLKRPDLSLSIFLHPLEKNQPEIFEKAKAHYNGIFKGVDVNYFPPEKPSFQLFDQVDVSIAAYSSTNLERLYAGFKTLYAPLGMAKDYYAGSQIEMIAAFDEYQLKILLDNTLSMSTEAFFTQNKLEAYHHNWFNELFKARN